MSGLECKNISKSYKDNKVLDNVSLNIEQGKIYGLIGRNGVGKTTLMSIMTGQNPADSGEVTYNGQPVWENAEALSHICFSREIYTKSQRVASSCASSALYPRHTSSKFLFLTSGACSLTGTFFITSIIYTSFPLINYIVHIHRDVYLLQGLQA